MREHPIIFTTDMIKAILNGTKTQTRRVIIPQPVCKCDNPNWQGKLIDWVGWRHEGKIGWSCYTCGSGLYAYDEWSSHGIICPYGQAGDRLWIRETFKPYAYIASNRDTIQYKDGTERDVHCPEDFIPSINWKPSIHMPRWASRFNLTASNVRIERIQDITEEDARAEGIIPFIIGLPPIQTTVYATNYPNPICSDTAKNAFKLLWDSINAKRGYSWNINPWVWVVTFHQYSKESSDIGGSK